MAVLTMPVALRAQDVSGRGISIAPAAVSEGRPGIAIDSKGGQVIDPTKNVLDLVLAAVKRLDDLTESERRRNDDLRAADTRFQDAMRDAAVQRINDLRDAETRRINELAAQKQIFDLELARVIRANQESSTLLLAAQLKEVKGDSSDRTTKLEQFANEQRGRASASDPATAQSLSDVKTLVQQRAATAGSSDMLVYLLGGLLTVILVLISIAGLVLAIIRGRHPAVV